MKDETFVQALAVLLALQALTHLTAARHMPLGHPEHTDARGEQQSAEVEGRDNQSAQPHTTTHHRKLLQGAFISRLAAEYDGTESADGKELRKTNDCLWRQNNDALKFAGILGGMLMGALSLCCGCIYCTLKLCGRNDDLETDLAQLSEVRITSGMWAHQSKKACSPAPTKPGFCVAGQKCLPPKKAAEKVTVVVEANTSPAIVPAAVITIVIDSSFAEEDAVEHSSTRESAVEESTVEKCGVQEDVAEQFPGEKGSGSRTVASCSVEQSSAAEAAAEQSSAPEAPAEESSAEEGPVGRSSAVHPEHCNAEEGIAEDGAVEEQS